MMKRKVLCVLLSCFLLVLCIPPTAFAAQPAGDITETGVDFLTDPPQQEVTYTAGEGTVTYTPNPDGSAVITMENAVIHGSVKNVYYQSPNRASAAFFAKGKVDLVLLGENTITVTEKGVQGIFLYDTDVTVKGTGSLTADTSAVAGYGPAPFSVMAGKDTNPATRTGHFTQEGGNITVKANPKDPAICLSVSNDLTIRGGSLTTEGATYGMVCSKGTLSIEGGKVICRGFSGDGISNYKGDILISGQDTSVAVYTAEKDAYSFGIMAEPDPDSQLPSGNIMISGGNVHIEAGQVGIYTESGEVGIFGGTVYTKAENQTGSGNAVGIYSTGNLSVTGGEVFACGMGEGVSGVGLYSETALSVSGGAVTAQGTEQAVSPAPDFSSYPGAVVYAAADFEGTQPEEYQENNLAGYRYFSIHGPQFSLRFENGAAVITAPYSTDAEVLFAAYDQTGTLTALERKKAVLTPGENRILPELFQPEQGSTVKVMLWDSAGGMKPLCAAENGTV